MENKYKNQDISSKQKYLTDNIINENLNPDLFTDYMKSIRFEGNNIENWSMNELKSIVKEYKIYYNNIINKNKIKNVRIIERVFEKNNLIFNKEFLKFEVNSDIKIKRSIKDFKRLIFILKKIFLGINIPNIDYKSNESIENGIKKLLSLNINKDNIDIFFNEENYEKIYNYLKKTKKKLNNEKTGFISNLIQSTSQNYSIKEENIYKTIINNIDKYDNYKLNLDCFNWNINSLNDELLININNDWNIFNELNSKISEIKGKYYSLVKDYESLAKKFSLWSEKNFTFTKIKHLVNNNNIDNMKFYESINKVKLFFYDLCFLISI